MAWAVYLLLSEVLKLKEIAAVECHQHIPAPGNLDLERFADESDSHISKSNLGSCF